MDVCWCLWLLIRKDFVVWCYQQYEGRVCHAQIGLDPLRSRFHLGRYHSNGVPPTKAVAPLLHSILQWDEVSGRAWRTRIARVVVAHTYYGALGFKLYSGINALLEGLVRLRVEGRGQGRCCHCESCQIHSHGGWLHVGWVSIRRRRWPHQCGKQN